MNAARRITLDVRNESLQLAAPFRISGYVFEHVPVTLATLHDGAASRVAAKPPASTTSVTSPRTCSPRIEALRGEIEAGLDREALRPLLPPGGARNALDCALWELEAQRAGQPVWKLAGIDAPRPLLTTFTARRRHARA